MSLNDITRIVQEAIGHVLLMCGPVLGAALVVGLVIAIFQATTSIQEQTLTFLPKFMTILLVIYLLGSWMFTSTGEYLVKVMKMIARM